MITAVEAVDGIKHLHNLIGEVPDEKVTEVAPDFFLSVYERSWECAETIQATGRCTERQERSIGNWTNAVLRWLGEKAPKAEKPRRYKRQPTQIAGPKELKSKPPKRCCESCRRNKPRKGSRFCYPCEKAQTKKAVHQSWQPSGLGASRQERAKAIH